MFNLLRGFLVSCLAAGGGLAQVAVTTEKDLSGLGLSLRDAVASSPSGGTIIFAETLVSKVVEIHAGEIVISKDLVIEGPGLDDFISIQGNQSSRLFRIAAGVQLTLRFVNLSQGKTPFAYGGAIHNEGTLVLEDCRISHCEALSGGALFNEGALDASRTRFDRNCIDSPTDLELGGGAILNTGTAILSDCTFLNNQAKGIVFGGGAVHSRKAILRISTSNFNGNQTDCKGGAVWNSGTLDVTESTFESNFSLDDGAGVFNEANLTNEPVIATIRSSTFLKNQSESDSGGMHVSRNAEAFLENCTFTGNFALDAGGAMENSQGFLTASACTIANNRAMQRGGGLFSIGETKIVNSILSGNSTSAGFNDLERFNLASARYIPMGANIIEEPGNSEITGNVDLNDGLDLILPGPALLIPLGLYGGATRTMPPMLDSPALDSAIDSNLLLDQRGVTRFVDSFPDIGAVEFLGVFNDILIDSDFDGLSNGIEVVTGTDPLVNDPGHSSHLRMTTIDGIPALSFGYVRSTGNRYLLRILRSDALGEEHEILSSRNTFIPNSIETPYLFIDDTAPEERAFYRLEMLRR